MSVSEFGSFTRGSAAIGVPQSVASRRIAALERHYGEGLFDRSTRRANLTPFGRDMLPWAQRLVQLADAMEHGAKQARLRPLRIAMPATCSTRDLAELGLEARAHELFLEFRLAAPNERVDLVRIHEVRAALAAVPSDEGTWTVPLGLASATQLRGRTVHLEVLRPGRSGRSPLRRVWIQPEDDVPHIRDHVHRARDAVGMRPAQVVVADALSSAVTEVFGSADLLLCSSAQAREFGLHWHPIGDLRLARGFDITAGTGDEAERVRSCLWAGIAQCLGGTDEP